MFAIIELLVFLMAMLFCFYLFMEVVYPFFTNGKVKPGWLFFTKYIEKQRAKENIKKISQITDKDINDKSPTEQKTGEKLN